MLQTIVCCVKCSCANLGAFMDENSIGWELKKTAEALKQYNNIFINECLEENNVSFSWTEGMVLAYIANHPKEIISAKLLLTNLQLSKATMSQTLTSLVSKGLIEYDEWNGDGRVKRVILTKKAEKVCSSVLMILDRTDEYLKEIFTQEELNVLKNLLGRIREHVTEAKEKEGKE